MVESALPLIEDLRLRMVPLAFRVARLCSAAQVLSGLAGSLGRVTSDLLPPFEAARDTVHRFHSALAREDEAEAARLLEELTRDVEGLRSLLADVDVLVCAEELSRYIGGEASVTAEALGRLVEFYAHERPRGDDTDGKLVRAMLALAGRESENAAEPQAVAGVLERRYLLHAEQAATLHPAVREAYLELRGRIDAVAAGDGFAEVEAAIAGFRRDLGPTLTCPAGLSLAVSLVAACERRREELARAEARPFAHLVNELDGVLEDTGDTAPLLPVSEDDDPEAIAELRAVAGELEHAVRAGDPREAGFALEDDEVDRLKAAAREGGAEFVDLVRTCIACRTAVDRLARAHTRSGKPDGVEPPPLPRSRALTFLREATRLENELNDRIQEALLRGRYADAKLATRIVHKLARSRLGLALLGDLPVTGRRQAGMPSDPATPATGPASSEQETLKRELEIARLMRDALLADRRPSDPVVPAAVGPAQPAEARPVRVGSASRVPTSVAARRRIDPERRKWMLLLGTLGVTAIVTLGYHLPGLLAHKPEPPPRPGDFAHSAPIQEVQTVEGAFLVVATIDWEATSAQKREEYVKRLWTDARVRGYHRMVVMNRAGDRPIALASEGSIRMIPLERDLAHLGETAGKR